jgi:hypothetical protein
MDQETLVSFDIEKGREVINALDRAGNPPEVAMWAMLPQYETWRFLLASSHIDGYVDLATQLNNAGVHPALRPSILLRETSDPFIQELRKKYAGLGENIGQHIVSERFGKQYIDEAYVYRIR